MTGRLVDELFAGRHDAGKSSVVVQQRSVDGIHHDFAYLTQNTLLRHR